MDCGQACDLAQEAASALRDRRARRVQVLFDGDVWCHLHNPIIYTNPPSPPNNTTSPPTRRRRRAGWVHTPSRDGPRAGSSSTTTSSPHGRPICACSAVHASTQINIPLRISLEDLSPPTHLCPLCFLYYARVAPYQIALHDGRLIFAPQDSDQVGVWVGGWVGGGGWEGRGVFCGVEIFCLILFIIYSCVCAVRCFIIYLTRILFIQLVS